MAGQAPSLLPGAQPRKDWGRVFGAAAGVLAQKRCLCTHRLRGIESGKARKEPNLLRLVPAAKGLCWRSAGRLSDFVLTLVVVVVMVNMVVMVQLVIVVGYYI